MKIEALNFIELNEQEKLEMYLWARDVIVNGKIAYPRPSFVQEWMDASGFTEDQYLLIVTTVLPARILLSIANDQFRHIVFPPPIGTKVRYGTMDSAIGEIVEVTDRPVSSIYRRYDRYDLYYGAKVLWDGETVAVSVSLADLHVVQERTYNSEGIIYADRTRDKDGEV